ncbi:hypothetical protein ACLQ3C_12005 [Gordonia sp. DT30]|uniref:hypothetical protein n=1 Tax=unclassified Gordonia (in: high G+C Gram-positive bacteria) TaxID=2657482 RepID=UPI003CE8C524
MTSTPDDPGRPPNPDEDPQNPGYAPPGGGYVPPQGWQGPPPNAVPGYAPPPPQLEIGVALTYGWNKYKANAGNWILFTLITFVVVGLINGAVRGFHYDSVFNGQSIVASLVSGILSVLVEAAFTRGALNELDGRKPAFGDFFNWNNLAQVFLAAILVWAITTIGFILIIIPGLIATFLLWYTLAFAIDRDLSATDAIKGSFELTSKNVGTLLLLAIVVVLLNIVGAVLCLVGLLVTGPVTLIASTYAYRVLSGGVVSPAQ